MSLFRNLALILVSTLVGICLAELVLRAIKPAMEYPYMPQDIEMTHFRPSLYLPFELKANHNSRFRMLEYDTTVRTNGLGMRDEEIDWNKPRILCLGDSFTFGNGVENEETFCAILEDLFDKRYDFVNVGFAGGFSPDAYALWLAKNRKTLGPRGIVIAFYQNDYSDVLSNDWLRNGRRMDSSNADSPDQIISPGQIISSDGARIRDNAITRLPPPIRKLLRNSYVVGFLRDRLTKDLAAGAPSPNSSHPRASRRMPNSFVHSKSFDQRQATASWPSISSRKQDKQRRPTWTNLSSPSASNMASRSYRTGRTLLHKTIFRWTAIGHCRVTPRPLTFFTRP